MPEADIKSMSTAHFADSEYVFNIFRRAPLTSPANVGYGRKWQD